MQIRLTRKFCDVLNGFDLRPLSIGQVIDSTEPLAAMLLAEGWAELVPATAAIAKPAKDTEQFVK